jgi:hypothetical protein
MVLFIRMMTLFALLLAGSSATAPALKLKPAQASPAADSPAELQDERSKHGKALIAMAKLMEQKSKKRRKRSSRVGPGAIQNTTAEVGVSLAWKLETPWSITSNTAYCPELNAVYMTSRSGKVRAIVPPT